MSALHSTVQIADCHISLDVGPCLVVGHLLVVSHHSDELLLYSWMDYYRLAGVDLGRGDIVFDGSEFPKIRDSVHFYWCCHWSGLAYQNFMTCK